MAVTGGGTFALRGVWTNDGTMTADEGAFSVGGTFDLTDLASLDDTEASFRFEQGTLQNTGTTFTWLAGYELGTGFEIEGGTIETVGGAAFLVTETTTWDGVTIDDDVTVSSQKRLTIQNGLTLNGTLTLGAHLGLRLSVLLRGAPDPGRHGRGGVRGHRGRRLRSTRSRAQHHDRLGHDDPRRLRAHRPAGSNDASSIRGPSRRRPSGA